MQHWELAWGVSRLLQKQHAYIDAFKPPCPACVHCNAQDARAASFKAKDAAGVTQINRDLLAKLDDPYTRLLREEEDAALAAEEEGKVGEG